MTRTALRTATLAFSLLTCGYALLCSSDFSYHHVIRDNMFGIRAFADWHRWLAVAWLGCAAADVVGAARTRQRTMWAFLSCWTLVVGSVVFRPVLPSLGDDAASLAVALIALAPPIWLAAIDHCVALPFLRHSPPAQDGVELTEGRLAVAVAATAVYATIVFAVLVPLHVADAFEPDLLTGGLAIGLTWSLVGHAAVFAGAFAIAALVLRLAAPARLPSQLFASLVLLVVAAAVGVDRGVCEVLGIEGLWRLLIAAGMALAIVGTVSAIGVRDAQHRNARLGSALDIWGGRFQGGSRALLALELLVAAGAAYAAVRLSARADWDFLLQTTAALLLWIVAFRRILRASPPRRLGTAALCVLGIAPLAAWFGAGIVEVRWPAARLALNRYVVYNPSFRLTERLLPRGGPPPVPAFQRFLRDNTSLAGLDIAPVDLDFVKPLAPAARQPPPDIFLFVVDSLRPDYLSPYNHDVGFTPRIQQFAGESVVFRNAMTRYGATGLSLPAIWMGAVGVHRQYVVPFSPMNTLEKLLIANRYRRIMSVDVLMGPLLRPWPDLVDLDRDRRTLDFDLCRTLGDLERQLPASPDEAPPIFGYSLPQNLHLSNLINASVPAGESYPGFHAPYATRVHAIDGCFGAFVDALKARRIYDHSVIVLTSDHGELLGEEGRWGHAYYLFPPILQIPLIVHLPAGVAGAADTGALSFTTDIAPTLYAALGYRPHPANALMGEPLVGPEPLDAFTRRRGDYVVEASYSAVFGVVRRNGRRVYIVDAVSGAEYAYDRDRTGRWAPIALTDGLRSAAQRIIREHIDQLRRTYRLPPYGGAPHQG